MPGEEGSKADYVDGEILIILSIKGETRIFSNENPEKGSIDEDTEYLLLQLSSIGRVPS